MTTHTHTEAIIYERLYNTKAEAPYDRALRRALPLDSLDRRNSGKRAAKAARFRRRCEEKSGKRASALRGARNPFIGTRTGESH